MNYNREGGGHGRRHNPGYFDKWFSSTVSREKGGKEKKARGKKKGK